MFSKYANIAFNLPIDSKFTYSIPAEYRENLRVGCRVFASFGKRKLTGVVIEQADTTTLKKVLPIAEVLDIEPVLNKEMLEFCRWISSYYFCPIGEVIFSSIPKSVLVESKILFSLNDNIKYETLNLTELQKNIIDSLKTKPMTIKQIEKKIKSKSARSSLQSLISKSAVISEHITSKKSLKPKFEKYLLFELLEDFKDYSPQMLENFLKDSKFKSVKQENLLRFLIDNNISEIPQSELLRQTDISASSVNSLAKKELIKIDLREVTRRIEDEFSPEEKVIELNPEQKSVLNEIESSISKDEFKTYLLFGVTGSGKTQVYIESIKKVLKHNKTAIVLVPEISLTPQLIHRFKSHFGNVVGVIHSRLSEGQRFDVFRGILSGEIRIVIGARSAIFAPLSNIGIIIVDEEHDHSYKQSEKNPKYNARDSAIIRAQLNNAVALLGSATPSLESLYNAGKGKYKLLELPHRALKTKQPEVEIVDMLEELKSSSKFVKYETPEKRFLSSKLISYINYALENKQSIMLLQNRRGYSAYLECQNCGNVKMCANCDITLIYHKVKNHLRCHYCGYTEPVPNRCEKCGSENITLKGTGTEKIEEEIGRLFPQAKIRRMDADTVRRKDAHRKILKSFHEREFDILVGTQMISKGLDFPNVFLVGVISADVGLLNPDFRASEKTMQLLMQVAGRPGRKSDYGKVVIQTMHSDKHLFPMIKNHNYKSFYEKEIGYRRNFNYPPFSRMVLIEVNGKDSSNTATLAAKIYLYLSKKNNSDKIEIMKPAPALIFKLKNQYRWHIIIKAVKSEYTKSKPASMNTARLINMLKQHISTLKIKNTIRISIDVDPLDFT
jgi:primosomal protein N' (replication factor Y)